MKLAAYAVAITVLLALWGCEAMVFQPDSRLYATPTDLNLSYREVHFNSKDGTRLSGWWLEPPSARLGTVIIVHGNAQNISAHFLGFDWLVRAGYEAFIFDYRGYGASEGTPALEGAVEDTEAALAYVLARRGGKVTVIGQSLGGALLFNALARQGTERIALAVFDSTFASLPQAGREALDRSVVGWPVQWSASLALTDRFDPIGIAPSLTVPKLYLAGSKDSIISPNHSWQLFDASARPRAFWLVTDAGHINAFAHPRVRNRFLAFLRRPRFDQDASAMLIFDTIKQKSE
ncbi:alpha/beta hydrolase [Thiomicrolovo sp. ZZH C-3]